MTASARRAALAVGCLVAVALVGAEAQARPRKPTKPKPKPTVVAPAPPSPEAPSVVAPAPPGADAVGLPSPDRPAPPPEPRASAGTDADDFVGPRLPPVKLEDESLPVQPGADRVDDPSARRLSAVTPGSASRWSNRGAMVPIVAEVEIAAPLPARAVPLLPGQATPGQRLLDDGERLTAHLATYAEYLTTVRQPEVLGLVRGRAVLHYDRIGGGELGVHVDLDYRGSAGALRLTDRRLNALYATWGLTDFRRTEGPRFGVAIGRLLVREAGLARADGLLLRYRASGALKLGVYGGLTGNPYGYNWRLARTEDLSTRWIAAGMFGSLRLGPLFADLAVGGSYANIPAEQGAPARNGLDRLFVFVDAGLTLTPTLDVFLSGWIDAVPSEARLGAQPLQNVELAALWQPKPGASLRLSASRFSTLTYAVSSELSFRLDPTGATLPNPTAGGPPLTAVDAAGNPIVTSDQQFVRATYTALELRGGYRLGLFEPFAFVSAQVRETGGAGTVPFSSVRVLPALGASYRDPELVDVVVQATGIADAQTDRRLILTAGVSRTFGGVFAGADARAFFGGTSALDGGLELSYTLPRDWISGRLMFRTMFRYFRENVVIRRLPDACTNPADPACLGIVGPGVDLPLVPVQESYYGSAGLDWRY